MTGVSKRLQRRGDRDFGESAPDVCDLLLRSSDSERVQAAIVFAAGRDFDELRRQAELAAVDWRDVLINGQLAVAGWEERLQNELGR